MEINESLILSFQHVTEELRKGGMKGIIWEMDRMLAVSSVFWASGILTLFKSQQLIFYPEASRRHF